MIGVTFYRLAAFFARRLPEPLSLRITELLLMTQWPFRFGSKANTLANLRILMPDASQKELLAARRRLFSNFARSIYYFIRAPFIPREELIERCDFNGLDQVLRGLKQSGCLLVSPHIGPWEIGGAAVAALGTPLHTVALPHPSPQVTRWFKKRRALLGIRSVSLGHGLGGLARALRAKDFVVLLVDRPYGTRSKEYAWLGHRAQLPVGHLLLAIRYNVPVVPVICVFDGRHRFKFHYGGPHFVDRSLEPEAAVDELQARVLKDVEGFVRAYPDLWFHYKRIEK